MPLFPISGLGELDFLIFGSAGRFKGIAKGMALLESILPWSQARTVAVENSRVRRLIVYGSARVHHEVLMNLHPYRPLPAY